MTSIHITGGGICKINGGEIAGNSVYHGGGGICVDRMIRCEINGGFIRGNLALMGGGIRAGNNSSLKITGGTIFGNRTGCKKDLDNTGGYGGGISLYDVAVFEMSGGSVSWNYAGGSGGGIDI
jgi:hypothetical protein